MSLAASTAPVFLKPAGPSTPAAALIGGTKNAALKSPQNAGLQIAAASAGKSSTWSLVGATLGVLGGVCSRSNTKPRTRAAATGSVSNSYDPTKSLGVLAPVGYWDPCGLMKERVGKDGWQWKDESTFEKYRIMELKHGRLAMLGVTGMLTTAFNIKFPGDDFQYSPEGFAAFESPAASGIGIIFLLAGYFELTTPKGDYKDPLGLGAYENYAETPGLQDAELAHGRLAMSAALTLLLCNGGGSVPSDVLRFGVIQPSDPAIYSGFFSLAVFVLCLAWTNPKGMETTPPEVYIGLPAATTIENKAALPAAESTEEKVTAVRINAELPVSASDNAVAEDPEGKAKAVVEASVEEK